MLLLALAMVAHGSGFYFGDSGIVGGSRGGAFVAGADTPFAQYYNPAGLVRIKRPTLALGGTVVRQNVTFERLTEDGELLDAEVNNPKLFAIPQINFATPLGDDLAFAFGFYSPFTPDYNYDTTGNQRYSSIRARLWQGWVGPSLAWRPVSWLSVGGGLSYNFFAITQGITVTTSGTDDPASDVAVDVSVQDLDNIHGNVGLIIEPHEAVSIGISLIPPGRFSARGSGSLDFSSHAMWEAGLIDQAVWTDDDVSLRMRLPAVFRAGVAVRPTERAEVELAWVYEGWSKIGEIKVTDVDVVVTGDFVEQPVEESFALPSEFGDGWSIRLGGEYEVSDHLDVRLGGFYETSSLLPANVSVALMDTPKVQVSSGLTAKLLDDSLYLDGLFSWVFFSSLEARESEVVQINAFDEANVQVVGNGDYHSRGLTLGLGARYMFR